MGEVHYWIKDHQEITLNMKMKYQNIFELLLLIFKLFLLLTITDETQLISVMSIPLIHIIIVSLLNRNISFFIEMETHCIRNSP